MTKPISKNRPSPVETIDPSFREADQVLQKYVAIIQQSPAVSDAEIVEQLIEGQCDPELAESTVVFVPLAFGRPRVNALGVKTATTYFRFDRSSETQKECELKEEVVFVWACKVTQKYMDLPEFQQAFELIADRSAEVHAITNAVLGGVAPEFFQDALLAPSILYFGEPTNAWWKIWKKPS